jgi:hypothetical protein
VGPAADPIDLSEFVKHGVVIIAKARQVRQKMRGEPQERLEREAPAFKKPISFVI